MQSPQEELLSTNSYETIHFVFVMRIAEVLRPKVQERLEKIGNSPYLDKFKPTYSTPDIATYNFAQHTAAAAEKKKKVLLLDAEGTFVNFNGWDIDQEVVDNIKSAGFENIAIVTNKRPRSAKTFVKLNWWAHQLGADIVFTPENSNERKPNPQMLHKATQYFEVSPEEALMVGDKRTADIKAANAAGIDSVWIENPRGSDDLLLDKVIRRPMEKVMHWNSERIKRKQVDNDLFSKRETTIQPQEVIVYKTLDTTHPENLPEWKEQVDDKLWGSSKIVNMGGPVIESVSSNGETAPEADPTSVSELSKLMHEAGGKYGKKFDEFMYEHGRKVATGATLSRVPLALIVAGLILTDKPKLAQAAHGIALLTDGVDGWASRKSKEGGTKEGGKLDQRVDKFYSLTVDLAYAIKNPKKNTAHLVLRLARELYVLGYARPHAERLGRDTSAVMSGKISTNLISLAQFVESTSLSEHNELANDLVQYGATGSKGVSAIHSQEVWKQRQMEQQQYENVTNQLLALAA